MPADWLCEFGFVVAIYVCWCQEFEEVAFPEVFGVISLGTFIVAIAAAFTPHGGVVDGNVSLGTGA